MSNIANELSTIDASTIKRIGNTILEKATELGLNLLYASIVLAAGLFIISILNRVIAFFIKRQKFEKASATFITSSLNMIMKVVLLIIILQVMGFKNATFTAFIAALSLAIGLAAKDNLANFASGLMILLNKPFKVGDRVLINGVEGIIDGIGFLFTTLTSSDGKTIYVPSSKVISGNIINYSSSGIRRVELKYSVPNTILSKKAKEGLSKIIEGNKLVLKKPRHMVSLSAVKSDSYEITLKVWVKNDDYATVQDEINDAVHTLIESKT